MNGEGSGGLPSIREIELAAERIEGVAVRTPLVESPALSRITGHEVYLKLECFQPNKAFKIRGAYNKVSQLKARGVVAASSGNHGIAVAYSAHLLDKKCTVVVPEGAIKEKVEAIESYGAEVVAAGKLSSQREAKAREIARSDGLAFVHPFNDSDVIAGQGTCGLEIHEQLKEFDSVLVPVGGGGLISGISIILKAKNPSARIFGVEPEAAPKLTAAIRAKGPSEVTSKPSIADGLLPSALGELPYKAISVNLAGAFDVSEEEIFRATCAMVRTGVVAEPSGAAPLAPLLRGSEGIGRRVVVVVSGGNISRELLMRALSAPG